MSGVCDFQGYVGAPLDLILTFLTIFIIPVFLIDSTSIIVILAFMKFYNLIIMNDYNHTWIFLLCVKCVPFQPKNLPKGRNFTYLEDPGISYLCLSDCGLDILPRLRQFGLIYINHL